jgi:hypothetical protein
LLLACGWRQDNANLTSIKGLNSIQYLSVGDLTISVRTALSLA